MSLHHSMFYVFQSPYKEDTPPIQPEAVPEVLLIIIISHNNNY